ncbi:glycosyltransferase family 2 protein [Planktosalinus lacus]|uniref:Glycosyl transferase n=1 Tax=Planktosalinus lacus TaxID=1526573 RepID=A0A8J2VA38_9FLAO|nr:glycosyltransferase [Planktosalinus lacus]GGD90581.1 glycosyl transferase [Planktosalinus lacus]
MIWFLLISIGLYVILMGFFGIGFFQLKAFTAQKGSPKTTFTLVIPFRNEAENLPVLMQSLLSLKYPDEHIEIFFINDASEDASAAIIQEFILKNKPVNWKILENERKSYSPKKDAITMAVSKATHDWIFTTDADCILPENLFKNLDAFLQNTPSKLIAGPVLAIPENRFFIGHYQLLESMTLAGVTMGAFGMGEPLMCNGAHLAYEKSAFEAVNGFEGNDHIASGDDLFLLEKMQAIFPGEVHFLKNNAQVVYTKTERYWSAVVQQRVRWAAKTSGYKSLFSKFTGIVVLVANVSILIGFWLLFQSENGIVFLMLILLKWGVDEVFVYQVNTFFKREINWLYLRLMAFLYPVLTLYIVLKALFGNYYWKGRTFKK